MTNAVKCLKKTVLKPGKTFQFTFADAGTYDYFCSVHPWMTGQVIVAVGSSTGTSGGDMSGMAMLSSKASDGTTVTISTSGPVNGQPLSLAISFADASGNKIHHQNYAITVTQKTAIMYCQIQLDIHILVMILKLVVQISRLLIL